MVIILVVSAALLPPAGAEDVGENIDPKADEKTVVEGNSKFAFDLYAKLKDDPNIKKTGGNLFFSPYSISTALAMTYAGARGETEKQMAGTLHFPRFLYRDGNPFHRHYGRLIEQLNTQGKQGDYELLIANALWAQKDYPFRDIRSGFDSFIGLNQVYYKAKLENVDFVNKTEKTRQMINQWVEDKTNEKIKNLIPQGALDALMRLVLTNAIYFKGDWASQFDAAATSEQDFYITSDKIIKAPLMYQKEELKYAQTDSLQLLEMTYKGEDLSMLVLLPKSKDGLADLEKELTPNNVTEWQKRLHKQKVKVYLPKFKMTSQFNLSQMLATMGMPDAFGRNADFSGMTGNKDLFISAVLHKAFVAVDEQGTEAAAATGVAMRKTAIRPIFRADHPFIFIIKDNVSQSILFMGKVANPTIKAE